MNALGYNDARLAQAIQAASMGLIHTSNLYYTAPQIELANLLVEKSFADRVFFSNSGAEANEGAVKFARKVQYEKACTTRPRLCASQARFMGAQWARLP